MLMRLLNWISLFLLYRYVIRVTCQHFCLFKEGGSNFEYTHVHLTVSDPPNFTNPQAVTGIGHDDRTSSDDPRHNTVSRGARCEFVTKQDGTPVKGRDYNAKYSLTVYFHAAPADPETPCPEGYTRVDCECGPMCFTLMSEAFDVWYRNRTRRELGLPPLKLEDVLEEPPREGSSGSGN